MKHFKYLNGKFWVWQQVFVDEFMQKAKAFSKTFHSTEDELFLSFFQSCQFSAFLIKFYVSCARIKRGTMKLFFVFTDRIEVGLVCSDASQTTCKAVFISVSHV